MLSRILLFFILFRSCLYLVLLEERKFWWGMYWVIEIGKVFGNIKMLFFLWREIVNIVFFLILFLRWIFLILLIVNVVILLYMLFIVVCFKVIICILIGSVDFFRILLMEKILYLERIWNFFIMFVGKLMYIGFFKFMSR